jgi:post-segregation antitoxin (ccd killing protein)
MAVICKPRTVQIGAYVYEEDAITLRELGVNMSEICRYAIRREARRIRRQQINVPSTPIIIPDVYPPVVKND